MADRRRARRAGGRVLFLDVNGDGLPDAVESGFSNGGLYTYLNEATVSSGSDRQASEIELGGRTPTSTSRRCSM
ncbi:MAG: hypothetical protein R3B70_10385 [Polyangiaceae bacterium]